MKHLKMSPRLKKNIVLIKLAAPKWVTLPKGSTFFAKYKRVKRDVLSDNVTIRHMYKREARRGQGNQGIKNVLVKGFRLAKKKKKIATSSIGGKLGKIAMENASRAYKAGVKKVKNKGLQKILLFDLVNGALDRGRAYTYDELGQFVCA